MVIYTHLCLQFHVRKGASGRTGTSENFIKGAYVEQGFSFFLIFCFMLHFEKSSRGEKTGL